jgi:hypothetical protein
MVRTFIRARHTTSFYFELLQAHGSFKRTN